MKFAWFLSRSFFGDTCNALCKHCRCGTISKNGLKAHETIPHLQSFVIRVISWHHQYEQIVAGIDIEDSAVAVAETDVNTRTVIAMGKGESVDLVAIKRQNFSATVNIVVTNNTDQFLDLRKEWVKGGEAINRPVSF